MEIKEISRKIREAYERGEYSPDEWESYLALDITERAGRYLGHPSCEDIDIQEGYRMLEEGETYLWHEDH